MKTKEKLKHFVAGQQAKSILRYSSAVSNKQVVESVVGVIAY